MCIAVMVLMAFWLKLLRLGFGTVRSSESLPALAQWINRLLPSPLIIFPRVTDKGPDCPD